MKSSTSGTKKTNNIKYKSQVQNLITDSLALLKLLEDSITPFKNFNIDNILNETISDINSQKNYLLNILNKIYEQ